MVAKLCVMPLCSETDSLLAKLLEMGYEPQRASVIPAPSVLE